MTAALWDSHWEGALPRAPLRAITPLSGPQGEEGVLARKQCQVASVKE